MDIKLPPSVIRFIDEHRGSRSQQAFILFLLKALRDNPNTLADISATLFKDQHGTSNKRGRPELHKDLQ